jgi:transcriptional regulator with XRE-family HTH domain
VELGYPEIELVIDLVTFRSPLKTIHLVAYQKLLDRLVEARLAAKISQEKLGKELGERQSYVSKVESRERRLDVLEFVYWAQAVGKDPAELIRLLAEEVVQSRGRRLLVEPSSKPIKPVKPGRRLVSGPKRK